MTLLKGRTFVVFDDFEIDALFETRYITGVKGCLVVGFAGELPHALFPSYAGPGDAQDAFLGFVTLGWSRLVGIDAVFVQSFVVDGDAQARLVGNRHIAVLYGDGLFNQVVDPQFVAGDIR